MVLVDGQGVPLGVHHVDGRKQRCYRRRWKIERTDAWLLSFRRLTVRYDHKLACREWTDESTTGSGYATGCTLSGWQTLLWVQTYCSN
jgi:hypothetical protein